MLREHKKMAQVMLDQDNFSMIQSQSRLEREQKDLETLLSTFGENKENQQDLHSLQDNNVIPKKGALKRRSDYSNTKVKARNLLTNVVYRCFEQSGFNNKSFIIYILSFLVQIFNPVNLDIKLDIDNERDMVKFLWEECISHDFVISLYKEKQYNEITQANLTY